MWDVALGSGAFGHTFPLPLVLGWEGTGTVEAVGVAVTRFAVGDPVIGYDRATGWLTERVAVPQTSLAHAPRGLDLVDAASLPIAGSTAIQTLKDVLHIGTGEQCVRGRRGRPHRLPHRAVRPPPRRARLRHCGPRES